MKISQYNLIVPLKTGKYIVYNTLHDSILVADTELKHALEHNIDALAKEHIAVLSNMGMVIDNDVDEKSILSFKYHKEKYSSPYSIFVILPTLACNLACKYCYERSSGLPSKTMDSETIKDTIAFIKKMALEDNTKTILIKFYGGEPLLNVDACATICKEVSVFAGQHGLQCAVVLQSNGTLLTESVIDTLSPYITYVELTLDGPQSVHDKTRIYKDGTGTYQDIITALDTATTKGIHAVVRINVQEPQDLHNVLTDLTEKGFKDRKNLQFYYAQTSNFGLCELFSNNQLCYEDENKALDMSPQLRKIIKNLGWENHLEAPDVIQKQKFVSCNNEKKARYVIDPDGDIYLCFFRAGQKQYKAGSLKNGSTFGPLYYQMLARNPLQFEECAHCVYLPLCGGGCAMRAYELSHTFNTHNCGSIKKITEKRILMYLQRKYPDKFGEE
jgi:uncharacterized protein